jgi:hypothetical protein
MRMKVRKRISNYANRAPSPNFKYSKIKGFDELQVKCENYLKEKAIEAFFKLKEIENETRSRNSK